jgi:hypothetical protein
VSIGGGVELTEVPELVTFGLTIRWSLRFDDPVERGSCWDNLGRKVRVTAEVLRLCTDKFSLALDSTLDYTFAAVFGDIQPVLLDSRLA